MKKKYFVIGSNVVLPGFGSFVAGETTRGLLQLLIFTLGILLWQIDSLRVFALPLLPFAWFWALFTSLNYKRRVEIDEVAPVTMVIKQRKQFLSTMRPERN
ncbi:MAG: hypothetical protein ABJM29_09225 [Rhizobiaceae bacterium]